MRLPECIKIGFPEVVNKMFQFHHRFCAVIKCLEMFSMKEFYMLQFTIGFSCLFLLGAAVTLAYFHYSSNHDQYAAK